jgi:thymidylate synthase (FAD)
MYTEFIETGSLYGYARLCGLRDAPDAQKEIRDYAQQVSALLEKKFPVSWAALITPQ